MLYRAAFFLAPAATQVSALKGAVPALAGLEGKWQYPWPRLKMEEGDGAARQP